MKKKEYLSCSTYLNINNDVNHQACVNSTHSRLMSRFLHTALLLALVGSAHGFVAGALRSSFAGQRTLSNGCVPSPNILPAVPVCRSCVHQVQMGLFGLGTPELAVIAGVALLILGPDQLKNIAKDLGKVSAELKQV